MYKFFWRWRCYLLVDLQLYLFYYSYKFVCFLPVIVKNYFFKNSASRCIYFLCLLKKEKNKRENLIVKCVIQECFKCV